MMEQRLGYRIMMLETEAESAKELKAALVWPEGLPRFIVTSRPCSQGLDPCACELLIVDTDGQAPQSLELLAQCRRLYPYLPVIVLVGRGDTSTAIAAMKAGAADCLEKPLEANRLSSAVMAALGNEQSSRHRLYETLTRTETRVLHLLLAGKTNLEVAEQFHRSSRTIEVHRRNIMRKLGASCVAELVREAFKVGVIGKESSDHTAASVQHAGDASQPIA